MRIGSNDLNENEAKWIENYSKDLLSQAHHRVREALNKKISEDDVRGLLKFLWSRTPTQISNDEAEAADIAEAEADEDYE
jgi:hypothetical protein